MACADIEQRRIYMRQYRKEHRVVIRATYADFLNAHPDYVNAYGRKRYQESRELPREWKRIAHVYKAFQS